MTRTTDDLNPEPFKPLGPPIRPPAPPPAPDKRIAPGVLQGRDGRLYTDLPPPKEKP